MLAPNILSNELKIKKQSARHREQHKACELATDDKDLLD